MSVYDLCEICWEREAIWEVPATGQATCGACAANRERPVQAIPKGSYAPLAAACECGGPIELTMVGIRPAARCGRCGKISPGEMRFPPPDALG
jgi:hypothetical protein